MFIIFNKQSLLNSRILTITMTDQRLHLSSFKSDFTKKKKQKKKDHPRNKLRDRIEIVNSHIARLVTSKDEQKLK